MSTFLGTNPVDPVMAFRAAIESSLDVMSSIDECGQNSRDKSKHVTITLFGNPIPTLHGHIDLTSVTIEDDGIGMDIATLTEKFRGAYFDSNDHSKADVSGRNGVGVKTNLQYWKEILVQTTTKGLIAPKEQWLCNNPDGLEQIYRKASKLKPGDPDTELRVMALRVDNSELLDFKTVPRDDSGTKVTLIGPRAPIVFDVEAFIKRQSHCIGWLSKPGHTLTVNYKNDTGRSVSAKIKPFHEVDSKDSFICHIKGNSKEDMHIIYHNKNGTKESTFIPADKNPIIGSIDLDLKVLDGDSESTSPNELIISICGANIYDQVKGKTSISPSIEYLMRQHHFKSSNGFSYRLHGYIQTDDLRLKKALRHNKSVLDEEDKYVRAFIDYLVSILKPLNQYYMDSLNVISDKETLEILEEIRTEFNAVLQKRTARVTQHKSERENTGTGVPPKHKEFKCEACGLVWKVPLEKNPSYCAEFNIDKSQKGCGSRDCDRNTHAKNDDGLLGVQFKWSAPLGSFLPARYEPNENTILLSANHPSFITTLKGDRATLYKKTVGIEKGFIAIAAFKAQEEGKSVMEVYGELLKDWFEHKSLKDPHKMEVRRVWKTEGISLDQI